jgi:hypothetical protein
MLLTFSKPKFVQLIKEGVKIHTIREDKHNRWKIGSKIHFWLGNPRNIRSKSKPYNFGIGEVYKIQNIEIYPKIDCVVIDNAEFNIKWFLDALAFNDGFDSWEEMKEFFKSDFKGKILFWDNCQFI